MQNAGAAGVFINAPAAGSAQGRVVAATTMSAGGSSATAGKPKKKKLSTSNSRNTKRSSARNHNRAPRTRPPVNAAPASVATVRDTYAFNLRHTVEGGLVLEVQKAGEASRTMTWGSDSLGNSMLVTSQGENTPLSFNQLRLQAFAGNTNSQLSFTDLVFSSQELSVNGQFYSGTVDGSSNTAEQNVITDGEMAASNWSLSGSLAFDRPLGQPAAKDMSFTIEARKVEAPVSLTTGVAAVPEPGTMATLLAAGAALSFRRRRI